MPTSYAGTGLGLQYIASNNLVTGTTLNLQNLQCFPGTGGTSGMLSPIGSGFTGTIWMAYTATGGSWTPQFVKIATVSAKSSS